MAKDSLGLEWVDSDNKLYLALTIVLAISILVVIATLILTRPPRENFTELYFADHRSLPEYASNHNFSFTIHNLENSYQIYNYSITTETYALDYLCEAPHLWINEKNSDPALYVKGNYTISFSYELKSGSMVKIILVDTNGGNNTVQMVNNNLYYNDYRISSFKLKEINSFVWNNNTLTINDEKFKVPTTSGYIHVETDAFVEFNNFQIKKNLTYPVYLRYPDSVYEEYSFQNLSQLNLTNYDLHIKFYGPFQLYQGANIVYYDALRINDVEFKTKNSTSKELILKINNDTAKIYYNNEYIATTKISSTPVINYNRTDVADVYVKSRDDPVTVKYVLPESNEVSTGISTVSILKSENKTPEIANLSKNLDDDDRESLEYYYENEKINYTDYILTTTYNDDSKNDTMKVALASLTKAKYILIANNSNKKFTIFYTKNKTERNVSFNITPTVYNRLTVELRNNTFLVIFNGRTLLDDKIQDASEGMIIYEYDDIDVVSAQIEDRSTGIKRIFKRQPAAQCDAILINAQAFNSQVEVSDGGYYAIHSGVVFNKSNFDIAKVQVSLDNGQEIHYWVRQE